MYVYVKTNGERVTLDSDRMLGEGREAEVYDVGEGKAVLIFKDETHPDYAGNPRDEKNARERLQEMQTKLQKIPANLSPRVIRPEDLVTDAEGKILGYTMQHVKYSHPLSSYAKKSFRKKEKVSNNTVMAIFRDLHGTVSSLHKRGVIIGDFQPDNVLVRGRTAFIIDTHSLQFGEYRRKIFKPKFVDPLLCDSTAQEMRMTHPHTTDSDWYAYTAMLMQSLIRSHPYGGKYRTRDPKKRVDEEVRPLHRITVFNMDVWYDRDAVTYSILPYDLLSFFAEVFEEDRREVFPISLLDIIWRTCSVCGTEIVRPQCSVCL